MLWSLIKALFLLAVLAALGLVAYAYLGPIFSPADFAAPSQAVSEPVSLSVD